MPGVSEKLPAHSPLGASGAHRWMVCPGSVYQSRGVEDAESEHAMLGTAAHALAEHCLTEDVEPWKMMGAACTEYGVVGVGEADPSDFIIVDKEMSDAVQSYLHTIEEWHPKWRSMQHGVEYAFHCPNIHEWFYGASDFWLLRGKRLDVWDYKHGAGIVVEAERNPQGMYYAAGVLTQEKLWNEVDEVCIHIFQPRGWHYAGPHRMWELPTENLSDWLVDDCIPAMELAMVSRDTTSGEHCRFCPARQRQCPALMQDMAEYEELIMKADGEEGAKALTPEQLGRILQLHEIAKIVTKAASATAFGMLSSGHDIPGLKLVKSRTNREYKEGAEPAAIKEFGKKRAFTTPALKSPAQLDEMPGGKQFTARWAFKPEGKLTVAVEGDPRRAIKRDVKSLFKPVK